jgi:AcrR family transcriptional regulator
MRAAVVAKVKDEELVKVRRRQIVDAAVAVFLEKSYHNATVGDVAQRVGLSQGAMYTYVRSKDDILYMICAEAVDAHSEAVRQAIVPHSDPVARLRAAIHAFVVSVYSTRDSTLVVYREAHDLEPRSIKALLARAGSFIETFESLLVEAKIAKTSESRILLANIVTYLPTVIANRAWYWRNRASREEIIAETSAFILRGLGLAQR